MCCSFQCHWDEGICDWGSGKMKGHSSAYVVLMLWGEAEPCPRPELPLETMLICMTYTDIWGHVDVCLPWCCRAMSGSRFLLQLWPCYHQRPNGSWCYCAKPWTGLPLETMLESTACTAIGHHAKVCVIYWSLTSSRCLWSMQSPDTMWKSMINASANSKGQKSFFCSGLDDCSLTVERET